MENPSIKKKGKEIPEDSSLGILLKRSREERHIGLDRVSEITRIQKYLLEAMENDQWDKLPSQVFTKGFLRSYSEFLGLDKEAIIQHYLKASSTETAIPKERKKIRSHSGKPYLVIAVSVLVLIFIVVAIHLNERNISIIDKSFQYLRTQSHEKKIEGTGERADNKQTGERKKELPLSEVERAEDAVNKTDLTSKYFDDTMPVEDLTIPAKSKEEKISPLPKLTLTANVKSKTWIAISIDEKSAKEYLFQPGQTPQWTAEKGFNILIGNAAGIEFSLNGKKIGNLGAQGQVVRIRLPEG